jgi:phosphoserine phosphatase RsbU/P
MKILIAEDDRVSRRLLQRTLEGWGHEVVAAADGTEAWDLFKDHRDDFQFVISDWEMPGMDGIELVRRVRQDCGERYVYIILLTAKTEREEFLEAMEAGADEFVTKPLDHAELHVRLKVGERLINLERKLAHQNEVLCADLEAAAAVQMSLLPQSAPKIEGYHFAWQFIPSQYVAGDIFNIQRLDEDQVGLYVIDVSGHGVPAAMLSVTLSRVLVPTPGQGSLVKRWLPGPPHYEVSSPSQVVSGLNERFPMEAQNNLYHTILYALLNTRHRTLTLTRAGHPNPIRTRAGQEGEILVTPGGLPAGMLPEAEYPETEIPLEPGDRIFFYSDGLNESLDEHGEMFGFERLAATLADNHGLPLDEAVKATLATIRSVAGDEGIDDDLTLLAIEVP